MRIELSAPPDMDAGELSRLRQQEAIRARELAGQGALLRLWRASSKWGNWGLWRGASKDELMRLLDSLPLRPFMAIEIHDLAPHPSDPACENLSEGKPSL